MFRKNILIVDDDADIRRLAGSALKQEGYDVLQADSGENALEILRTTEVDAVILDIMLPGMDGLETLRHIRSDRALDHVSVIMLSVKSSEIDNVVGLELGADDYIGKPIRYHRADLEGQIRFTQDQDGTGGSCRCQQAAFRRRGD